MEVKHPFTDTKSDEEMPTSALSSRNNEHQIFNAARSSVLSEEDEQKLFEKPFYFETDHVALRGNKDYNNLLRTVVMLESQRTKAIKDLDLLLEAKEDALQDPIGFVSKLQHKVDLRLPKPQKIAAIPNINWDNYSSSLSQMHRHKTRNKREGSVKETDKKPEAKSKDIKDPENRSETFNKPWSVEEQQRLEQLLVQFPPEEVEAKRWQKIANALGNRTMLQVASRVQKYFIKLAKAGLPIPGRMPNVNTYSKKSQSHRHQRHNRFYHNPSTFLASHQAPVYMADDDIDMQEYDSPAPSTSQTHPDTDVSDEEGIPAELRQTEEYQHILKLKRLRQMKTAEAATQLTKHTGFQCDSCRMDPIIGTRWHCLQCPEEVSVDFCSDCIDMNYENDMHKSYHELQPIHNMEKTSHVDADYTASESYLDPNYMPAS